MEDARLIKEANKTKRMVVFSLVLILVAIISVGILYFQLREKERQLTKTYRQLEKTSDQLEIELRENRRLKEELARTLEEVNTKYVEPRDIEAAHQIQMQIDASKLEPTLHGNVGGVFSPDRDIRKKSVDNFITNSRNDPGAVKELVEMGTDKVEDQNGTVNTLLILTEVPADVLKKNKREIRDYINKIETLEDRPKTRELADNLKKKIQQ